MTGLKECPQKGHSYLFSIYGNQEESVETCLEDSGMKDGRERHLLTVKMFTLRLAPSGNAQKVKENTLW